MTVHSVRLAIDTSGPYDMHDITGQVQRVIQDAGMGDGIATVFVRHTTAAIMIGEHEAGLIHDIPIVIERLVPRGDHYRHNDLNRDDNAHSHVLGSVIGPSETIPFTDGELALGTWQQIVLIELDTHPRSRQIIIRLTGE